MEDKELIYYDICNDNRFEVIEKAKQHLLKYTNIETSPEEMAVLDNFLFRCWQMGWFDRFDTNIKNKDREVLDILRKHIVYDKEKDYGYADFNFSYPDFEDEDELNKVKEWLNKNEQE